MYATPLEILQKYWNHHQFKSPQEDIIQAVLDGKDTVALLPTGGGKSVCYQIPTLLLPGVCVVISPLIALMKDQVDNLNNKGIKAIALTAQLSVDEMVIAFDNLKFGNFKFLYLSPEKLQSNLVQEKIKELNVALIAIDEAHCISEWGHDFRPSYLQLNVLRELQPNAPIIALTATATSIVLNDIEKNLNLKNATVFKKSFQRKNLIYRVIYSENSLEKLLQILLKVNESAIVYTYSRKQTKEISNFLNQNKLKSSYYHGGLSASEKNSAFNNWMKDITPIMVATNAFGMGIDKPTVRTVIHLHIPDSIENYIQEAGRAGRDGKQAFAVLIVNKSTIKERETNYLSQTPSVKYIKKIYGKLNQFYQISYGEFLENSVNFSLQEFCETYGLEVLKTYNAIKILERENIILLDENFNKKSTLQFLITGNDIFKYLEFHTEKKPLIELILRSYGGIFDNPVVINEYVLAKKLGISKIEIQKQLNHLQTENIVSYDFGNTDSKLWFLVSREDDYTINSISKNIKIQNKLKFEKLQKMLEYCTSKSVCRNILLLAYFDEKITEPCGMCDVCKAKIPLKIDKNSIETEILKLLTAGPLSSAELELKTAIPNKALMQSVQILLEKNKIGLTSQNKYKLKV